MTAMNLHRILIANRGEIAVRIIRTCDTLGIETILAASEADLDSVAARMATETICIGPSPAASSYLDVGAVMGAAKQTTADAIHPGYGFLAENARLASECERAGVVFIGPTRQQLLAIGDKLKAREHALQAGLTVVPGGDVEDVKQALSLAARLSWPVLIKAVSGGGGRGMKPVGHPDELADSMVVAMAEAGAAFGDSRVYLEHYVESARHIEVQLLGDGEQIIHLGDRDCSVQRRYQKLLEEAPAPGISDKLRTSMHQAAVEFGLHLNYRGLGTVEFLLDTEHDTFYFLEMNARIQVEHPVTEAITGLDLVAEQIAVAEGKKLRLCQSDVRLAGHALECRINAEDASRDFLPSPGLVTHARFPAGPGVRVDTHIESGVVVPPFYDSLLAKIIVQSDDRSSAMAEMKRALLNCGIEGLQTNLNTHTQVLSHPEFVEGAVDTGWFSRLMDGQNARQGSAQQHD